jgi:hypothetical protein
MCTGHEILPTRGTHLRFVLSVESGIKNYNHYMASMFCHEIKLCNFVSISRNKTTTFISLVTMPFS